MKMITIIILPGEKWDKFPENIMKDLVVEPFIAIKQKIQEKKLESQQQFGGDKTNYKHKYMKYKKKYLKLKKLEFNL